MIHCYGDAERLSSGEGKWEGRKDRVAHELGRARTLGGGTGERGICWKGTQDEGEGGAEGGRAVFMVVGQSGEARLRAPSPIGGPLNPGGRSSQTQIASTKY